MTYCEFYTLVYQKYNQDRRLGCDVRLGQTAYNLLATHRPDLAQMVRGTRFDPFHRDMVIGDFFSHIATNWGDGAECRLEA